MKAKLDQLGAGVRLSEEQRKLVTDLEPTILQHAHRWKMHFPEVPFDELVEHIRDAVIVAACKYDPSKGPFLNFAVRSICNHKISLLEERGQRKKRYDREKDVGELDIGDPLAQDPFRETLRREVKKIVDEVLCSSPLREKQVVELRVVDGLSEEKTATELGIGRQLVRKDEKNFAKKLRRILRKIR